MNKAKVITVEEPPEYNITGATNIPIVREDNKNKKSQNNKDIIGCESNRQVN